jgi:hypothetical protein
MWSLKMMISRVSILLILACSVSVGCGKEPIHLSPAERTPEALCKRMAKGHAPPSCIKGLTDMQKKWPKAFEAAIPCLAEAEGKEESSACLNTEISKVGAVRSKAVNQQQAQKSLAVRSAEDKKDAVAEKARKAKDSVTKTKAVPGKPRPTTSKTQPVIKGPPSAEAMCTAMGRKNGTPQLFKGCVQEMTALKKAQPIGYRIATKCLLAATQPKAVSTCVQTAIKASKGK